MNQTYVVKAGDTLYGISNQFGVSVTELDELNGIKGSALSIGQVLTIPSKEGSNPNNMFMYTVKAGDTLYGIAQKYNTSVQKIIDLNYLKNTSLSVGQVIRIPEMYTPESEMVLPNYTNYIVKKGDTLYSIASQFGISVDTLIKDNALTSNTLKVGASLKIRIPADTSLVVEECIGPDYTPPTNFQNASTYTVKAGDNLYSIAKKFNTSVSNLISLNGLKSNSLSIGQQLKVPASGNSSTTNQTYIVKSGDSLYSIAKKFNTTVDSIKKKNNMSSNLLSIGQKLII